MDSIKGHDFSFQIITELEIARKNLLKCRFVNTLLSGVDIHHCSFEDCNFTGLRVGDVGLSHLIKKETYPKLKVADCTFSRCVFDCTFFRSTIADRCTFLDCSFLHVSLDGGNYRDFSFTDCTMKDSLFSFTGLGNFHWFGQEMLRVKLRSCHVLGHGLRDTEITLAGILGQVTITGGELARKLEAQRGHPGITIEHPDTRGSRSLSGNVVTSQLAKQPTSVPLTFPPVRATKPPGPRFSCKDNQKFLGINT